MSGQEQVTSGVDTSCSCKIGRNVARYGIEDFDAKLLDRRTEGASLRRLETVVNETVLDSALADAEADVVGDVSSIYQQLTGDDVSVGERTEITDRLTRSGVDADSLLDDFVSYQTVRTHLRDCLDVDTDRQSSFSIEDAHGTVEWARSRSAGIVERTVERLQATDEFHVGDIEVSQTIRVACPDCGSHYRIAKLIDRGGCECDPASEV